MKTLVFIPLYLFSVFAWGQEQITFKYWISFSDKNNTPYSIHQPYKFLSSRAIERRVRQGIAINETDLPVDPQYIQRLENNGAKIHAVSKWMNAAIVIADSVLAEKLLTLDFVQSTQNIGKHPIKKYKLREGDKQRDFFSTYHRNKKNKGYAAHHIEMVNGNALHQLGHKGEGMIVAVLDGGFTNVDIMPFFDSLQVNNRLLDGRDIVDNDDYVYESSTHGSNVLSVMASNLPGLYVGTAPEASYVCVKTEDVRTEFLVEECNWVIGAEFADSLGADIINSSLGYTAFNDKTTNHNHKQLDGETAIITKGAELAFSKGMLVVNSAGNSGSGWWKYIGFPADAKNVLSIGATDSKGNKASFSSLGPTADGRIKPNVSAMGQAIPVASIYSYELKYTNGSSFSSPLLAGMAASLWSAFPDKTNAEIFRAIELSGHQSNALDINLGYGIPDFMKAYQILKGEESPSSDSFFVTYNAFNENLEGVLQQSNEPTTIRIKNLLGQILYSEMISGKEGYQKVAIPVSLQKGDLYYFEVFTQNKYFVDIIRTID